MFLKFIRRSVSHMVRYNEVLGVASTNVAGYSNGNDEYFSGEKNFVHGIFTGYRWQCVEYARRWLLLRKTCIFRNIPTAADIWTNLDEIVRVTDGKKFSLIAHRNGSSVKPKKDSILIYPRCRDLPYGHVAIITEVGPDYIRIAEQNYRFSRWPANYSRQISMGFLHENFHLRDHYKISGWMEISGNENLKPLDQEAIDIIQNQIQ